MKEEINLMRIFEIVLKLWWVILIFALIGVIVAFSISSFFIVPLYTSNSKVYVSGSQKSEAVGININDINLNQRLVGTYIEILTGNSFLEDVAAAYNTQRPDDEEPISAGHIKRNLEMSSANETEILQIEYSDTSPEKAQQILEIILKSAPKEIARVIKGCQISIVDYADVPVDTSYPNVEQNTFIGFFLGIVFGIVVIFLREIFDTRIKDDDDLKGKYGVAVLGMIPNLDLE